MAELVLDLVPMEERPGWSSNMIAERWRVLSGAVPDALDLQFTADAYTAGDPIALQLRAMNMTYESIKERGALMVIPTGMNQSMDPGIMGMAAASYRTEEGGGQ